MLWQNEQVLREITKTVSNGGETTLFPKVSIETVLTGCETTGIPRVIAQTVLGGSEMTVEMNYLC